VLEHNSQSISYLGSNSIAKLRYDNTFTNSRKQSQMTWPELNLGRQNEILQHICKQPQNSLKWHDQYLNLVTRMTSYNTLFYKQPQTVWNDMTPT